MIFRRTVFFVVMVVLMFGGAGLGIAGADNIVTHLVGPGLLHSKSHGLTVEVWLAIGALSMGAIIGYMRILTLAIFPMYFLFPEAAVGFSWQKKSAAWEIKLLTWYADHLKKYADEQRRA
jgi:hypothetical protein